MNYDLKGQAESTWAGWSAAVGVAFGAVASQLGADEALVVAVTALGAATGRVLTVIIRRALVRVGLGG